MNYTPACFIDAQRHMPGEPGNWQPTHYHKLKPVHAKHHAKTAALRGRFYQLCIVPSSFRFTGK